ncbi:MAG: hypothetical protein H6Q76_1060 [Firmicutes bacterium]|nr:hypothetical protein [Bacillota bacterium]
MYKKLWYLVLAVGLSMVALYFAPLTGLSATGQRMLAVLTFIVVVWATEAVSYPVSALMLLILMMWAEATGKTSMNTGLKYAVSGFASATPLAVVAATAFAIVVQKTGLSERVVYKVLQMVSGGKMVKAKRLLAALFCIEVPLSFMVPSSTGRTAIYLSIAEGLEKPFKFSPVDENGNHTGGNPMQRAIYVIAGVMPAIMGAAFLTGSEATMLAGRLISEGTNQPQYWGLTVQYLLLPALILMAAFYFISCAVFPSSVDNMSLSFIHDRLEALGPIKRSEKYVIGVFVCAILLWITDSINHIPTEAVLFLMAIALFLPVIGPGNWKKDSKSIAWGSFIVIAVSLSFTTALSKHGVMKLIAVWLSGLGLTSMLGLLIVLTSVLVILRIAISSHTGATVLFVPLAIELGKLAGLDTAHVVALAWVTYVFCRAAYLLPQQSSQVILVYDYGFFTRKDMFKLGLPLTLAAMVIYIAWGSFVLPFLVH